MCVPKYMYICIQKWSIKYFTLKLKCVPCFFFQCFPAIFKSCWGEEKEREKAVEEVSVVLKILEDELKEKKFFGGENVGLVDIVAVVIGFSLGVYEEAARVELLNKEKLPRLCNWIDDFLSNSFIKESLPPRDKLIAYLRNRFRSGNASKQMNLHAPLTVGEYLLHK